MYYLSSALVRKRVTSAPAEGPACGLDLAGRCKFPLRAPHAQKWHVYALRPNST